MIHTHALTRDFALGRGQTVHAVRGIALHVDSGELVAVLGPNGAGKTTTMRMLTTLIAPTSGTATVAGHDVVREPGQVRRRIGYVGQGNGAGHAQRVRDELATQGRIYGLDRRDARRRADELLDALDLTDLATRKVADLSGGQRRRLDVAMGLVHRPPLLFLDEPSTGLDPQNRANLWDHVLRMRSAADMTIVLTTHYLDEADSMAERVVIVDHGEIIADDSAAALKAKLAGDRIVLTIAGPGSAVRPDSDCGTGPADRADAAARLAGLVERLPGARDVVVDGDRVEAHVGNGPAALPELLRAAVAADVPVGTALLHQPTLDDVFLALTGRSLREGEPGGGATDPQTRKAAAA
ncbi:ATP-binding cassette domain-containing protein [Plantactinospora sp. B24E8]|uniref:ATP-binding cassette domain-containing protein n=1 Tax=Plantactinospora sp. B24E8 TaxID=3153567 RepID=UPI00325E1228